MNKPTLRTIEQEVPQKNSVIVPITVAVVSFVAFAWLVDHLIGGCTNEWTQALTWCPIIDTPTQ